jgi:hypothetical protein
LPASCCHCKDCKALKNPRSSILQSGEFGGCLLQLAVPIESVLKPCINPLRIKPLEVACRLSHCHVQPNDCSPAIRPLLLRKLGYDCRHNLVSNHPRVCLCRDINTLSVQGASWTTVDSAKPPNRPKGHAKLAGQTSHGAPFRQGQFRQLQLQRGSVIQLGTSIVAYDSRRATSALISGSSRLATAHLHNLIVG